MTQPCTKKSGRISRQLLATTQLPVLPPGGPYLLKAMSSEEIDFAELAAIVEKFPSIAARLIALANSPWSSPVVSVTSLEMACARLGFFVVRSISVALSIASVFNPRACPAFDPVHYWSHALLTADLCTAIVRRLPEPTEIDGQAMRTAGLLHNLGLLWLASSMPAETDRALALATRQEEPGESVNRLLEEHCGIGFCEAGACLAEAWHFPALLVDTLRYQQEPDYDGEHREAARLVGAARWLIRWEAGEYDMPPSDPRIEALGIDAEQQAQLLQHLADRKEEILELAQTLFST